MTTDIVKKSFRVRWWMWAVLLVLLLATAAMSIRITGMKRLREAQAAVRAQGLAVTPAEFVALAPPIDAARQRRLGVYVLSNGLMKWGTVRWGYLPFNHLDEQRFTKTDQDLTAKMLIAGAPLAADVGAILDNGPVVTSIFGFCERDPARLARMDLDAFICRPVPNMGAIRIFATWWAVHACQDIDSEPHLHRLDQWIDASSKPGSLFDDESSICVSTIRDETYLWLATRGRLNAERLEHWAAEPAMHRSQRADGLAGERVWMWDPLSRMTFADTRIITNNALTQWWLFARIWPLQGFECAYAIADTTNAELRLRNKTLLQSYPMPWNIRGVLCRIVFVDPTYRVIAAVEDETKHRLKRVAAIIAVWHRRTGTLPAVTDLPSNLLAAQDADVPQLLYEAFPPHRFRIGINPKGSLPPSIPADHWTPDHVSMIGSPPSTKSVDIRSWSIEIDLEAILVPPPVKPIKTAAPHATP